MRTRFLAGSALVASVVMAVTSCSPDPEPSVTPSASPSSSAVASSSPSPSAAALPVWEQAGPGWFLVSRQTEPDSEVEGSQEGLGPGIRSTDDLVMVSPDGDQHDVGTLAGHDTTRPIGWTGQEVSLFGIDTTGTDVPGGTVAMLDLESGESVTVADTVFLQQVVGRSSTGAFIEGHFWEYGVRTDDWRVEHLCKSTEAPSVAPGGSEVACFDYADESSPHEPVTRVVVADTSAPWETRGVAEFPRSPEAYRFAGWWSPTEFLFAREGDGGDLAYFALDIATEDLRDFEQPVSASADLVDFDHTSRTFYRQHTPTVAFFAEDGDALASIECDSVIEEWESRVTFSGERALVKCSQQDGEAVTTSLYLVDMTNGNVSQLGDTATGESFDPIRTVLPYGGN